MLIVGGTGAGKSSTIKALFETEGYNLDIEINSSSKPVTQEIKEYQLSNLTIYDGPGLGDGSENDSRHMEKIKNLLEKNDGGKAKIDLVLVIVNVTTRDLESTYKTINEAIMPYMEEKERILIALNKCDKASDNPDITFDYKENKLSQELKEILEEKVKAIKERIKADTEIDVDVIYYAAGYYNEDTKEKRPAYNLNKLLAYIVDKAPLKKRLVFLKYQSKNKNDFKYDDNKENYAEKTKKSWLETIKECVNDIADFLIEAKNLGKKIVEIGEDLIALLRKTK
ncbi:GTPase family protein [Campylobacter jejuni]|uniref:GTPase family protein n=1 Tax=Campylobacter jejuni TaxID=197 RepID=UPI002740A2EA|nr:GTPase [Campylobacter jejuni]